MKTTTRRIIIIIVIAAIISGIIYKLNDVKRDKKNEIDLVHKAESDVPVTIVFAKYSDANFDILYHGTFEPNCEVSIVSEAQGKVKEYLIEEGSFVAEGKVIARLENDITSYQLELAEVAYQKAKSDLKRFENLSPGEAVSTQQLEDVKLALSNAKNTYLTLKKQYKNTFVEAPISGIISKRYIERGTFIAPGTPVADIIDTRKMKFIAWFSATDLVRVKVGQPVKITTDLYPNVTYEGVIKVVSVKPDESKRYRIQAEVQNNLSSPLFTGADGILTLSLKQEKKNIIIPRGSIIGSVTNPTVYVVEKGVARLRQIVIAEIINGQAFISGGLNAGEQVVLSGQINIEDNTRVRILEDKNL